MAARILSISTIPLASSPSPHSKSTNSSSLSPFGGFKPEALVNSLLGSQLSLSRPSIRKHRRSLAILVTSSLPTTKERALTETPMPKWSAWAIRSFAMGGLECRKFKYPKTGTEGLLMGILVEGTSDAAKFLRAHGITLFKVRDECINLLGKSELIWCPEYPPLTEQAQSALDWAVDEKLKSGESGEITASHLLLGIWAQKESDGHKIMAKLGFDDEKAAVLAKTMDKDDVMFRLGTFRFKIVVAAIDFSKML